MEHAMRSLMKYSLSILLGVIIGVASVFIYSDRPENSPASISVIQKSGSTIAHSSWDFKGPSISFSTDAEGRGSIDTTIPKTMIPEARAWMSKVHGLQFNFYYHYFDSRFNTVYGLSYWHRWGSVAIGGGVVAGAGSFGVQSGAQIWW